MNIKELNRSTVLSKPLVDLSNDIAHIIYLLTRYSLEDSTLFTKLEDVEQEIAKFDIPLPLKSAKDLPIPGEKLRSESMWTNYRVSAHKKLSAQ